MAASDPVRPRALVVGLTGGIAAGKSAVAELFQARGITVVDTDALAHALTAAGGAAIPALVAEFGPEVLAPGGALDRAAMRTRAFSDPAVRQRLERVLHGRIRALAEQALRDATSPYALLAIPLLAEAGADRPPLNRVLVVDCPEPLQRQRALQRPGLTARQLDGILAAQATRAQRLAIADDVIDNSGSLQELQQRVGELDARYRELASVHTP